LMCSLIYNQNDQHNSLRAGLHIALSVHLVACCRQEC